MALKAKVANKVQTNGEGLVEGIISAVLEIPEKFQNNKGEEISEEEYDELKRQGKKVNYFAAQFEFLIEAEGSQKPVPYKLWTRQSFNNEKYERDEKPTDYNDFTRLMLQLEVIKESDLKDLNNPILTDFDVESVEGLKISFELEPSKKAKAKGLKVPKLTSIQPIK